MHKGESSVPQTVLAGVTRHPETAVFCPQVNGF